MEYLDKTSCLQAAMMMLEGAHSADELVADGWDATNVQRAINVIERNPEAQSSDDINWDACRYLPGCSMLHVGWRVRFQGIPTYADLYCGYDKREHPEFYDPEFEGHHYSNPFKGAWGVRFHDGQRIVMPGELATIIADNGWDYRFTYEMELDGMTVRPGPGSWCPVGNKDRPPHPTTEKYIEDLIPTRR